MLKIQSLLLLAALMSPILVWGQGPNKGLGIIPDFYRTAARSRIGQEEAKDKVSETKGDFSLISYRLLGKGYREVQQQTFKNKTRTVRSQYFYQGLPVIGSEVAVNFDRKRRVVGIGGFKFKVEADINTRPSVSESKAVQKARVFFPHKTLFTTHRQLAILCTDKGNYLVWSFILFDEQDLRWQFMVDAHDGKIRAAYTLIQTNTRAVTSLVSDGKKSNHKVAFHCNEQRLNSKIYGTEVRTYNMRKGDSIENGKEDSSHTVNPWEDPVTATAHYYTEEVVNFYKLVLGRNSLDDNFFTLRSRVHFKTGYDNAFWDGSAMTYGDGSWDGENGYFSHLCVADVVCHELTHGLTNKTSNLTYVGESGAMNEAFSDIIASAFEYWLQKKKGLTHLDWRRIGEDCIPKGSRFTTAALRYMDDPTKARQPKEYKGIYWYSGQEDNGGVHVNSGVGSRAFYLLAAGGKQNKINVKGIGVLLAAKVFYYSNIKYLTSLSVYGDWPQACLQACHMDISDHDIKKFGKKGITRQAMITSVKNCWKAVKVAGYDSGDIASPLVLEEDQPLPYGFAPGKTLSKSAYLRSKGSLVYPVTLKTGLCYTFTLIFKGQDADLYLYDQHDVPIVASKTRGHREKIIFTPKWDGKYTLVAHAFKGKGKILLKIESAKAHQDSELDNIMNQEDDAERFLKEKLGER